MDILGIRAGSNVADIGAGLGWFTVRAVRLVGPSGMVYAVEINRDYLDYIEKRAKRENLTNINADLGTDDDPQLSQKSVDAVLLLKTYHEVAQPIRLLKRTRASMRPCALLGVIDRNGRATIMELTLTLLSRKPRKQGLRSWDSTTSSGRMALILSRVSSEMVKVW